MSQLTIKCPVCKRWVGMEWHRVYIGGRIERHRHQKAVCFAGRYISQPEVIVEVRP